MKYLILAILVSSLAAAKEVKIGEVFHSPDNKYSAIYTTEGLIKITKNAFPFTAYSVEALTPVESLQWLKNSRGILTIEHIAGGSEAVLYLNNDDKWVRKEIDPSIKGNVSYRVKEIKIYKSIIYLIYKISNKSLNGALINSYELTKHYNLNIK